MIVCLNLFSCQVSLVKLVHWISVIQNCFACWVFFYTVLQNVSPPFCIMRKTLYPSPYSQRFIKFTVLALIKERFNSTILIHQCVLNQVFMNFILIILSATGWTCATTAYPPSRLVHSMLALHGQWGFHFHHNYSSFQVRSNSEFH